jgi:glucose-6-phosphate isomerase
MKQLIFDFNNMFSHNVGTKHGVTEEDLKNMLPYAGKAHEHIRAIISNEYNRIGLGLEWANLPHQDKSCVEYIQNFGDEVASSCENVISLGIGGSYLGLKAAQDALASPYYNEFADVRKGRPRIYFDGNNLDPDTLSTLLANLNPKKTFVVVVSKSGETAETRGAFVVVENWLKRGAGKSYGRQIFAITDPKSGALRKKVSAEQAKDPLCFRNLPVMKGVGGRFSELNIGLLHLAIIGVKIQDVLDGAKAMAEKCSLEDAYNNPALMYAIISTILYRTRGKDIAVIMPFCETLKSTAEWYVQLLAESLGKKYARTIDVSPDGVETWRPTEEALNCGRTPVPSRGTGDLHSIQQNNIEGENNKAVTFVRVEKFRGDIKIGPGNDILSGQSYAKLMLLAEEATEWALVSQSRPNCAITMPEVSPRHWGELLFFFEMATAYEGELLNVNAYDQPGVEGYKNYLYFKLGKTDIPQDILEKIRTNPLKKDKRYIIA